MSTPITTPAAPVLNLREAKKQQAAARKATPKKAPPPFLPELR
jgi:hypothetical protein